MGDILIAVVGRTDPIRSEHDGPILHIVRHQKPEKAFLILTEEIGHDEAEYHYNEEAIHLLDKNCEVETIQTGIKDAHSYDALSLPLLAICNRIREENPDKKILVNITSGTPQMETVMCMIAISDPEHYVPVQISTPLKRSNNREQFDPKTQSIKDWFETDMDNLEETPPRYNFPELMNFRRPIIQFQILSLIQNYDYTGALQLYEANKSNFSEKAGLLLKHANDRLNLRYKEAEALAVTLNMKQELYPISQSEIKRLMEFYNSMCIKQYRGELNDFIMRLEIMAVYLGIYTLENCMRVSQEDITTQQILKNSKIMYLNKNKCVKRIPGIDKYLDEQFSDKKQGSFEWGRPLNGLSIIHIIRYISKQEAYKKYELATEEMLKWVALSGQVRNPAAHTIISITDDTIRKSYENRDSLALCKAMRTVLKQIFGKEGKNEAFDIYETINRKIKMALENNLG